MVISHELKHVPVVLRSERMEARHHQRCPRRPLKEEREVNVPVRYRRPETIDNLRDGRVPHRHHVVRGDLPVKLAVLVGLVDVLDVTRGYRYVAQSGFRTAVQIRLVDVETVADETVDRVDRMSDPGVRRTRAGGFVIFKNLVARVGERAEELHVEVLGERLAELGGDVESVVLNLGEVAVDDGVCRSEIVGNRQFLLEYVAPDLPESLHREAERPEQLHLDPRVHLPSDLPGDVIVLEAVVGRTPEALGLSCTIAGSEPR